jgi:hypothetical protein
MESDQSAEEEELIMSIAGNAYSGEASSGWKMILLMCKLDRRS